MRICFIQHNPGARTVRTANALSKLGHECVLVTRIGPRMFHSAFREVLYWGNVETLREILRQEAPQGAHIWHVGQDVVAEWLTPEAALLCPGSCRLIHDARDLRSLIPRLCLEINNTIYPYESVSLDEMSSYRSADGVLHVSQACAYIARKLHSSHPEYMLAYSYTSDEELVDWKEERIPALVYSGAVDSAVGSSYRNYGLLFERIARYMPLHVFHACGRDDPSYPLVSRQYRLRGVEWHDRVPDRELTAHLAAFQWGVVGFGSRFPLGMAAMPNKLFEYLSAGVVPVVFHDQAALEYVTLRGIGVGAPAQLSRLPDMLTRERWLGCLDNIRQLRGKLTWEHQAKMLGKFYKRCRNKPKRPPCVLNLGGPLHDPYAQAPLVTTDASRSH